MKHFLTTIVSDVRLRQIMAELRLPEYAHSGALDRDVQPLFEPPAGSLVSDRTVVNELRSRLAGVERGRVMEALVETSDERGDPVLVGLRRSALTDWTAVTVTPGVAIAAPLRSALVQIGGAVVFLLLTGGLAAHFMSRQVERPLNALASSMTAAKREVGELSEQLLAVQEDERRRIARELHDSTAQHLIAATLSLMQITALADGNPKIQSACSEIEALLDKGLKELRIFTYLLHPPNLESEGLSATLTEFVDGFCHRTGLEAAVRVSGTVDYLPFELQRSILRVAQEAMANVQRHARASRVSLVLRHSAGRLILRIRDDGRGIPETTVAGEPQRFGVGIYGMRARLRQFGGELRIRTSARGTTLLAVVPLTSRARANPELGERTASSPRARELLQAVDT